jgi:3-isopropylmalate dehydrogenase
LYEPIHGSAPDIAGFGVANPYGAIYSSAMLLRHSLGLEDEAHAVESAVFAAIELGALTGDLVPQGTKPVTTTEAGDAVLAALKEAR